MAKYHVTLKATLSAGDLYWVADVSAGSEEQAMEQAEALFLKALDGSTEWSFSEADVEAV